MGQLKILTHSDQPFIDRGDAAEHLANELMDYAGEGTVVLGIPRGGVVIAHGIAKHLSCEMDVVLARKIGAPDNPELAIGAVSEDGKVFMHEDVVKFTGASETYINVEKDFQLNVIRERLAQYREVLPKVSLEGKHVVVTDDGIATGATMQAAIWAVKMERVQSVIAAIPVGPVDSLNELRAYADQVICLRAPAYFYAIGQFYYDFDQVSDEQVIELLKMHRPKKKSQV